MGTLDEPNSENAFLQFHVKILRESLFHYSGRYLVESGMSDRDAAEYLYQAPFALLSHNAAVDPVFNYANLTGQKLFAMNWTEFTRTHSRNSAEPAGRQERARLLRAVSKQGFIDDYQGVRISKIGRRFLISNAIVWNLVGQDGCHYGQAAKFEQWKTLDEKNS